MLLKESTPKDRRNKKFLLLRKNRQKRFLLSDEEPVLTESQTFRENSITTAVFQP